MKVYIISKLSWFFCLNRGKIMHIPDNYLSPSTCAVMAAVMVPIWKRAAVKTKEELSKKKMPLLGICAAFSFLIMMFNIPLPGGTTGHAIGAVLVAILLGPYEAVVAVTIALAIQALFFGDGGILAFGANCFNMAFIMPFTGYFIYKFIASRFKGTKGEYAGAFIAGYIAINAAAFIAAIEFGIQPVLFKDAAGFPLYCPYGLGASIPAMMIPHMLLAGFVEGVITAAVLGYIRKVSPSSIHQGGSVKFKPFYALIITLIALVPLGLFASGTAWGEWGVKELETITEHIPSGMENGINFEAPMPGYSIAGIIGNIGYVVSAALGVAVIVFLVWLLFMKKGKSDNFKSMTYKSR
jgi:cobalt/nickel transport system permease protein